MSIIINLIITALAVIVSSYLLAGVTVAGFGSAFLVAIVLAIVNVIIRPVLLFFSLPLNILTLGLFTFVINAILIMIVDVLVPGFTVKNFGWALAFSLILAIVSYLIHLVIPV